MINDIYNKDVIRLAADISRIDPLAAPQGRAHVRSPLCGSTMDVELRMENGRIADYAQDIKACALGQASASIVARAVIGKTADEIARVRTEVERMLKENGPVPNGEWASYAALVPARNAPARHGAILLPFDAVLKAAANAAAAAA